MSAKTIILTGASDGIGAAAARQLADSPHRLLLVEAPKLSRHRLGDGGKVRDVRRRVDVPGALGAETQEGRQSVVLADGHHHLGLERFQRGTVEGAERGFVRSPPRAKSTVASSPGFILENRSIWTLRAGLGSVVHRRRTTPGLWKCSRVVNAIT